MLTFLSRAQGLAAEPSSSVPGEHAARDLRERIRDTVATAAARAGFDPRTPFESGDVARAVALVAGGLGVAVLPRSDAERHRRGVVALPFRDKPMTHELLLARRTTRRLSPAAARFLHDAIGESGPRGA